MKKILVIVSTIATIIATSGTCAQASSTTTPPPFAFATIDANNLHINYDSKVEATYSNLVEYNQLTIPKDFKEVCVPGRVPTFAFVFTVSAVGTYTLYGAGAGPVTAAIIYIATDGNRKHTRQAIWGCVTGMVVGGVVKWLSVR